MIHHSTQQNEIIEQNPHTPGIATAKTQAYIDGYHDVKYAKIVYV
jgi:hypothetical protein